MIPVEQTTLGGDSATVADSTQGLEVAFRAPLPEHAQKLMDTLGVIVTIDEAAPDHCCFRPSGVKKLTRVERRAAGMYVWELPR